MPGSSRVGISPSVTQLIYSRCAVRVGRSVVRRLVRGENGQCPRIGAQAEGYRDPENSRSRTQSWRPGRRAPARRRIAGDTEAHFVEQGSTITSSEFHQLACFGFIQLFRLFRSLFSFRLNIVS